MTGVVAVVAMFEKLSVTLNVSSIGATGFSPETTAAVTASPRGGSGSYTYSWTYTSGEVFGVATPAAASTTFAKAGVSDTYIGVYTCTVTDAAGATASAPVTITIVLT